MKNTMVALLFGLILTACGGGSGGGEESNGSADIAQQTPTTPASESKSIPFDEVVIPDGFNLNASYPVLLDISLSENENMYLSVYGKHNTGTDGSLIAEANSRIIAGPMQNGKFKARLNATSTMNNLLIEAWYDDETRQPFRKVVSLPQDTIRISD
ncbi:hypothetical protein [Photobacterium sp. J15]|uniref:hypothetical protein n=1 Tax=Photobacterium sp. J15 TaxID=265901 RepID=UPI0007E3AA00|nr:hypothetical protein [Photobacterium sp. J15]